MNSQTRAIDSRISRRRWLAASLMLFSLAALLVVQMAGAAQTGVTKTTAMCMHAVQASQSAQAVASAEADSTLRRLIDLHRGATRLSDAPPPPYYRN
jgi:hypothetical protein